MIIIPAIDIKKGKCVRLLQGRMDQETVFSDAPVDMALRWEKEGAEIIHIVDLDGAVQKQPENLNSIKQILEKVKIPVQIGGGIRDENAIKMYLDLGAARVIIGTEAIKNPAMVKKACRAFPGRIIVGIDARNGLVAVEGWTQTTTIRAVDLAKEFEDSGVYAINFTDIHRDGMQTGPNIEETRLLAEAVSIPVVASGGVATIEDIRNLLPLQEVGVAGVIAGRSLYAGTLNLQDAVKLLKKASLG